MEIRIGGKKAVLVAVDVQNKFYTVTEGLKESVDRKLGTMNRALDIFHDAGSPVVLLAYDPMNDCTSDEADDPDAFVDGLRISDSDYIVHKSEMNSFLGTRLEQVLRKAGAESVVLMGLVSHLCVLATYFGAHDRNFSPYILEGGTSATDEENVKHVEAICRTVSLDDLSELSGN
ncbi:MAG: cysteine hydrolase [Candidatus Methanomethylophilaceae archaeon]|nr:cysteine hydrolase [Candidatus Methanomethylophilaceae archaeon]